MEVNNPKYKGQGIHLIASIFTIDQAELKVLLIKRKNEPFASSWALVGGALYNDEDLEDGLAREIYEKTGLTDIEVRLANVFGKKNRSPVMRMVAISYIGMVDKEKVNIFKNTLKTSNANWFSIDEIPNLAYDHNEIVLDACEKLKQSILTWPILKVFFPDGFTLPELQKLYESILKKKFDRRNFKKKLLQSGKIIPTEEQRLFEGKKKAKVYRLLEENEFAHLSFPCNSKIEKENL